VETQLQKDSVNYLTDRDIEKLKEKNRKYFLKTAIIIKTLNFSNLNETLKDFQDA